MAGVEFLASFADTDAATANDLAGDLAGWLHDEVSVVARQLRHDPLAQDVGTTVAIIAGTSSFAALAKGVAVWLARRQDARLVLRRKSSDGEERELLIAGTPGRRTERLVQAFLEDEA